MGEAVADPVGTPCRVLVIDDDEDTRDLIEAMLDSDERFDLVGVAREGRSGLSLVEWLRPDAVILDLQVRGLDGLGALPEIRRRAPECRIVVLSAFPDLRTLADVVVRGADLYLDKANAFAELLPALTALGQMGACA